MTAILKRKVIDWYRRRVREHQQIESNADEERFAFDPFTRWGKWKAAPNSWKSDPAEGLNRSDFWAVFSACLEKLPSRMHDAFILRYLEEETGEVVCQEMKLTATNLWVILHRARLQMWKCLSKSWFENQSSREERPC